VTSQTPRGGGGGQGDSQILARSGSQGNGTEANPEGTISERPSQTLPPQKEKGGPGWASSEKMCYKTRPQPP